MSKREAETQNNKPESKKPKLEIPEQTISRVLDHEEALRSILDLVLHMSKKQKAYEPLLLESNKSFPKIGHLLSFSVFQTLSREGTSDLHQDFTDSIHESILDVIQVGTAYLVGQGRLRDAIFKTREGSKVLEQVFGAPFSWVYRGIFGLIPGPEEFEEEGFF